MTTAANVLETRDGTATPRHPGMEGKDPDGIADDIDRVHGNGNIHDGLCLPLLTAPPHAPLLRIFPLHGAAHKQGQIQNFRIRPCFHKFRSIIAVEYSIKCITHFLFLRNMLFLIANAATETIAPFTLRAE